MIAKREQLLRAAPHRKLAVPIPVRRSRMRLYVSLMHSPRMKLALHHHIRLREPPLNIPVVKHKVIGDIRGLLGVPVSARPERRACHCQQPLMQDRRALPHSVLRVQRRRQDVVLHIHQRRRLFGDMRAYRRNRRDRMPSVQRLFARHYIAAEKPVVHRRALFLIHELRRRLRKIRRRNDRMHARQRQRAARVDAYDARVRVRAAYNLAMQQPRHSRIRRVPSPPRNLIHPVVPYRPRPHHPELLISQNHIRNIIRHKAPRYLSLIPAASKPCHLPRIMYPQTPNRATPPTRRPYHCRHIKQPPPPTAPPTPRNADTPF